MNEGPASADLRHFYSEDARDLTQVMCALKDLGLAPPRVKHIAGFENRATPRQYVVRS